MKLPSSPAAQRNKAPILDVLKRYLTTGRVLEVASGTGEHVAAFAAAMPDLVWQPSDVDAQLVPVIDHRTANLTNVNNALHLDVLAPWPDLTVDAVIMANMLHISDPATLPCFFQGAAEVLIAGGIVHVYGPFKKDSKHTSASNQEFDASLKSRNALWGIRDLETVIAEAAKNRLSHVETIAMPANNFSLIFQK